MARRLIVALMAVTLGLFVIGCGKKTASPPPTKTTPQPQPAQSVQPEQPQAGDASAEGLMRAPVRSTSGRTTTRTTRTAGTTTGPKASQKAATPNVGRREEPQMDAERAAQRREEAAAMKAKQ